MHLINARETSRKPRLNKLCLTEIFAAGQVSVLRVPLNSVLSAPVRIEFTLKNDAKSFIVRIWIESTPGEEQSPTWRGVIEHVGSEDRKHFHNLSSVTQFISEKTGLTPSIANIAWWQSAKNWVIDELRKFRPNHQ